MPASSLSLIASAATGNPSVFVAGDAVPEELLSALRAVTDPRCRRGVRHQLVAVLGIAVCAVLAGARSYVAIAEWAHDLPAAVRLRLGIERVPPSETAIRRVLQAIDPQLLDRTVSGWLASRARPRDRWRAVAVDGKTARGARTGEGRAVHLLAALDHADGVVLGQRVVDGKSNEITAFAPLLDGIDITDVIITADALHTQREHADYLLAAGRTTCSPSRRISPRCTRSSRRCRGATSPPPTSPGTKATAASRSRTVKITAVSAGIGFPHARLAIQVVRRRRALNGNESGAPRPSTRSPTSTRPRSAPTRSPICDPRTLVRGESAALGSRRNLRRGPLPDPHRPRPRRDGDAAEPRDQHPPSSRRHQHRRRDPPRLPTSQPQHCRCCV